MNKLQSIKEYFTNLDLEMIKDSDILENIYTEINKYENVLILDLNCVNTFETLVKKSNMNQIIRLCKKLDIKKLSTKKTGSRFLEVVFDTMKDLVYLNEKIERKHKKYIKRFLVEPIQDNFEMILVNKNGSHLIRKFIDFTCHKQSYWEFTGKHIFMEVLQKLENSITCEGISKNETTDTENTNACGSTKTNTSSTTNDKIPNNKRKKIKRHKDSSKQACDQNTTQENESAQKQIDQLINDNLDMLITAVHYIKINYSKRICRKITQTFMSKEYCKNKVFTHIFEDIVNIADKKTLEEIYKKIENDFKELAEDRYAVYFIMALVSKNTRMTDSYYSKFDTEIRNINVILRIVENYCRLKQFDKVQELMAKHFGIQNNMFKELLLNHTETPDTKYIPLILLCMQHDKFNVNKDFVDYFEPSWAQKKYGISLLYGFYTGDASNRQKIQFAKKHILPSSLNKKKDGMRIISLVKSYRRLDCT